MTPIGRHYRSAIRRTASKDFAKRAWRSDELCYQCRSLGLGAVWFEDRAVRRRIQISRGDECPLCRYFFAVLSDEDTGSLPDPPGDTISIVVDSAPESWDHSQRRIIFADEARLNLSTRHTLQPTHKGLSAHSAVSYRIIDQHNVDFDVLKTWIDHCREQHTQSCSFHQIMGNKPMPSNPGFKVINCFKRRIYLANMNDCSYVALSYVWGRSTKDESEVNVKPGCLPSTLPNTIEDAIKATLRLGFKYLWIDKYCIDQSDAEDKRHQIMMMDIIYQAATITIIAAAGSGSHSGLPGMSCPRESLRTLQLDGTAWAATRADHKYAVKSSTWFTRGWTYQEAFFSRRRMIFTPSQVLFECNAMSCYETWRMTFSLAHRYHNPLLSNPHSILTSGAGSWSYHMHISAFTKRSLTNASDALRATRGLLRSLATKEEDAWQQFWGILVTPTTSWKQSLDPTVTPARQMAMMFTYGLCWHVVFEASPNPIIERTQGLPSWSWAGWVAAVQWPSYNLESDFDTAHLYKYSVLKQNGAREVLSEDLAARIFFDNGGIAAEYTFNLAFEAEVIDVQFTYFQSGIEYIDYHGQYRDDPGRRASSNYAVKATANAKNGRQGPITYLWPLLLTPHVEAGSGLHVKLCGDTVNCVVLNNVWGLVVQTKGDVFERVGLIRLWCQDTKAKVSSRPMSHLKDHFPCFLRELVLV